MFPSKVINSRNYSPLTANISSVSVLQNTSERTESLGESGMILKIG